LQWACTFQNFGTFGRSVDGFDDFRRDIGGRGRVVLRRGPNHRHARPLGYSINKLFLLIGAGTGGVNLNVLAVTRCLTEEVEDSDSIGRVCFAEWISMHVNLAKVGHSGKPGYFCGISQFVVSEVYAFEGKEALHTGECCQPVRTEVKSGDGR
jgi:hypothetical protein